MQSGSTRNDRQEQQAAMVYFVIPPVGTRGRQEPVRKIGGKHQDLLPRRRIGRNRPCTDARDEISSGNKNRGTCQDEPPPWEHRNQHKMAPITSNGYMEKNEVVYAQN
mmetsp:Transcript_21806/g.50305  ORF Transcript_21806/g.50305 Transcript_21806/m.50305 type:complete len:108 (+) Transcript_21806:230-553(+)